jgi:hypothetical protein
MRFLLVLALCLSAATAQQKKILYMGEPAVLQELQGVTDKARIVAVDQSNVIAELADADAFIGTIKPEYVRAGKKLQWTQIMSAGVETVLHRSGGDDLKNSNIILTNNQIVQGPEIADHAMAMLLTMTRGIHKFIGDRQSETWQPRPYGGIELNGKTAVVIGVGVRDERDRRGSGRHPDVAVFEARCEAGPVGRSSSAGGRGVHFCAAHGEEPQDDGAAAVRDDEEELVLYRRKPGRDLRHAGSGEGVGFETTGRGGCGRDGPGTTA